MQLQIIPLVIVAAYLIGMLLVGFIVGKLNIKDSKDYMLAGRRMGLFMVAFSLSANNIGGGSTTGLAEKAFGSWGMSAMWYVLAASVAMIPLAYFAPKIRKTMAVTIPEVVGRRFGKVSSTFTAILSILSLFCLTSSQIAASGSVVATLTGVPTNVALVIAGLVVILYTTFGGMIADQVSDLVQFVIILFGLAIATPFVIQGCGGWETISAALPPVQLDFTKIGWVTIIGYIFNYFCTFLAGPEMVSRFETAKDEKTARNAAFLSAVLMAAMSLFPTLLGLAALAVKDTIPNLAESGSNAMLAVTSAHAPAAVVGLISAAIICATMSSADSNLLCMSTMVMNDLYLGLGGKKDLSEKQIVFYTRLCNVLAAAVAIAISMAGISIVTMNTFAFGIRCAGPFAAYGLGLVVPKATRHSGIISLFAGTIGFCFWQWLSGGDFYLGILPVVFGCDLFSAPTVPGSPDYLDMYRPYPRNPGQEQAAQIKLRYKKVPALDRGELPPVKRAVKQHNVFPAGSHCAASRFLLCGGNQQAGKEKPCSTKKQEIRSLRNDLLLFKAFVFACDSCSLCAPCLLLTKQNGTRSRTMRSSKRTEFSCKSTS